MMRTDTAQNKTLSYEARGMLAYLLSKPDNWEVRVKDLILEAQGDKPTKAGKAKVYGILDELAEHKYIKKPTRYQDDKGRWVWTAYEVHEIPYPDLEEMEPYPDLPDTGEPDTVLPDTANREIKQSTELQSTDNEVSNKKETSSRDTNHKLKQPDINPDIAAITKAYEANIGPLTPMIVEDLKDTAASYSKQWILDAIKVSVEYNKRSWRYCTSILERWKRDGKDDGRQGPNANKPQNGYTTMSPAVPEDPTHKKATPDEIAAAEKLAAEIRAGQGDKSA